MAARTDLRPFAISILAALMLGGCAANGAAPSANAPVLAPPPGSFDARGLEAILNKRDDQLVALFGVPRLDVIEGQARKLQFANDRCALDIFLYPPEGRNGGERRSNYAEARDRQGNAVDTRSCVAALRL